MNGIAEQDKRKFWESCGWEFKELKDPEMRWKYPDGTEGAWFYKGRRYTTMPDLDMNSLFEYAVPILKGHWRVYELEQITIDFSYDKYYVEIYLHQCEDPYRSEYKMFEGKDTNVAIALYNALWPALQSDQNKDGCFVPDGRK